MVVAWLNNKRKSVEAKFSDGGVRGRLERDPGTGVAVAVFRGIPYAAPPVGELRWKPPQPAEPWDGVRDASRDGPEAPQLGVDFLPFLREVVEKHNFGTVRAKATLHGVRVLRPLLSARNDEDCLYLNVRTPHPQVCYPAASAAAARAATTAAKNGSTALAPLPAPLLPVMIYFHGGDHHDGGGSGRPYYKPNVLPARGGVVLVTFNYRLGILGHMTHPELSAEDRAAGGAGVSGNYSLLDQVAALRWVQRNIATFGGDPGRVTIFGSSAGGEAVTYMMASPLARGLFHRAVAQSPGSTVNSLMLLRHPFACFDAAENNGADFADRVVGPVMAAAETGGGGGSNGGSSGSGTKDSQLARLRALPATELLRRYRADAEAEPQPRQLFYPVVDGHVLPRPPLEVFWRGEQAPVPFLIGSNRDEGSLCFAVTRSRTLLRDALYPSPVRHGVGHGAYGDGDAAAHALADLYDPGWRHRGETDSLADQQFLTDRVFGVKVHWLATHHNRRGHPVFCYEFAAVPPLAGQRVGAFHGAEMPFVFGAKPWFAGGGAEDRALSLAMVDYWSAFARYGDPNGGGGNGGGRSKDDGGKGSDADGAVAATAKFLRGGGGCGNDDKKAGSKDSGDFGNGNGSWFGADTAAATETANSPASSGGNTMGMDSAALAMEAVAAIAAMERDDDEDDDAGDYGEGGGAVGAGTAAVTAAAPGLTARRPHWPRYRGGEHGLRLVLDHRIEPRRFDRLRQLELLHEQVHHTIRTHAAVREGEAHRRWPWPVHGSHGGQGAGSSHSGAPTSASDEVAAMAADDFLSGAGVAAVGARADSGEGVEPAGEVGAVLKAVAATTEAIGGGIAEESELPRKRRSAEALRPVSAATPPKTRSAVRGRGTLSA